MVAALAPICADKFEQAADAEAVEEVDGFEVLETLIQ